VCTTDPYCCDTAWDLRCVEEARTLCDGACQVTSTTVVSVSTTIVTSTTVPICRRDEDCNDGDPCTVGDCDPTVGCVHEPLDCTDDDCTADACDPVLGCVSETDPGACRIGLRYGP